MGVKERREGWIVIYVKDMGAKYCLNIIFFSAPKTMAPTGRRIYKYLFSGTLIALCSKC